jgi:hypothetical protein
MNLFVFLTRTPPVHAAFTSWSFLCRLTRTILYEQSNMALYLAMVVFYIVTICLLLTRALQVIISLPHDLSSITLQQCNSCTFASRVCVQSGVLPSRKLGTWSRPLMSNFAVRGFPDKSRSCIVATVNDTRGCCSVAWPTRHPHDLGCQVHGYMVWKPAKKSGGGSPIPKPFTM